MYRNKEQKWGFPKIALLFSSVIFCILISGCAQSGEDLYPRPLNPSPTSGSPPLPGPLYQPLPTTIDYGSGAGGSGSLVATWIDVGQGGCIFFEFPNGQKMMFDAGNNKKGNEVILPFLKERGINHIDLIIISHNDADHSGGLDEVLQGGISVEEVWFNGLISTTATSKANASEIELRNIKKRSPEQDEVRFFGNTSLLVLNSGIVPDAHAEENEDSIVVKILHGSISFLLTGDAAVEEGDDLVADYGKTLASTILNVPHHGTRFFSLPFIQNVSPRVSIFQAGKDNNFGHPTAQAIDASENIGAEIYRTDVQGEIRVLTDGLDYQVQVEKAG
ncbi:ComEC/Rec2 family competence protein [Candidatus Riflebacteria bacterium]